MTLFKIKNISIKKKGVLAPMQEYSHLPFRLLCKEYNSGLTFSEMVSTSHVIEFENKLSQLDLVNSVLDESPVGVQLFGDFKDKQKTLKAVSILDDYKFFDIIDLNLGCPSLKIINSKSGSYNLKQFDKIIPIIKEVVSTSKKPITVKTRLGFSENLLSKIHSSLENIGVSALSVHGRLATENYSHKSDFLAVKKIKSKSSIPIIYNGDVSEENFKDFLGFDGIMVGREALGNPFIFKQIDFFEKNNGYLEKENNFYALKSFVNYCDKYPISFSKYKVSIIPFFKNKPGSSKIRDLISQSKDILEIKEILNRLKVL